ncbi:hypothetical protein B0H14DRAFT_3130643 [Mycena olivaceomarginata]|nr:hypothetical protein B0H14DRAFT_3130643 [Mycena olivaceomarginata]
MYGSGSGANPLLMQAFRGSGSGSSRSSRSSPFPTPNPPAFSHTRSFSTSHHTAAHSTLSSPGLSYASLNDDDMLSLSSPIPTGFPDLYPVPATNSSESSEILLTCVDSLGRDLNFIQGEIRWDSARRLKLSSRRRATPPMKLPGSASPPTRSAARRSSWPSRPSLRSRSSSTRLSASGPLADFDTDSDSAPRTKIGEHVRGALIYMLELRYPHLGLCVEHWKALRIVQDRYRFWAAPFRDRLISYDAPVPGPPPPGPSPPGAPPPPPPAASMAHKHAADDSADSEFLAHPDTSSSDKRVPPPNTEPDTLLADVEQSTVPPPNTEPNTLLVNVEQSTDVVPDAGGADGAPLMQPDMFDDIVVEPPPAPPASTPGSAPAPPPPPPVTTSRVSKGKLVRATFKAFYCPAEYKIEWSRLQSEDAARVKVYEKYANTLKNSKPKPTEIPWLPSSASVLRSCWRSRTSRILDQVEVGSNAGSDRVTCTVEHDKSKTRRNECETRRRPNAVISPASIKTKHQHIVPSAFH